MTVKEAQPRIDELRSVLEPLFGELSPEASMEIAACLDRVELKGGSRLLRQGDPGDSLYIVVSGRLQAVVLDEQGDERVVGEIVRGESVGEMALLTGEPRMASIYAIRDSLLLRLSRPAFEKLVIKHPGLLMSLSQIVIRRLGKTLRSPQAPKHVRNVAVVFHGRSVDAGAFTRRLAAVLESHGRTLVLDSKRVSRAMRASTGDPETTGERLARWIDDRESDHRFIVWRADRSLTDWSRRCLRQADRVLVVADFEDPPRAEDIERTLLTTDTPVGRVPYELVLLHPNGDRMPRGTRRWLEGRDLEWHHHVRLDRDGDFERVGRFLAGKAVGIVFAGGGARGFAHIGVLQALRETGVPLDMAAGTSIGAIIGAGVAMDWGHETCVDIYRTAFTRRNPLNDYNVFPLVSLMRGHKIDRLLQEQFGDRGIEDLWLPFFCISSNLTRAVTAVHRRGLLWKALRASVSLPGVVPPVVYGHDLHIDGGTSDNFPVTVMREIGAGKVIASNLPLLRTYELNYEQVPSAWRLVWDRYITRRRALKVPGMVNTLIRATVLGSLEKGKDAARQADLYFETPLRVGLMNWDAFDRAMETGYRHAVSTLAETELVGTGWIAAPNVAPDRSDSVRAGDDRVSNPAGRRNEAFRLQECELDLVV